MAQPHQDNKPTNTLKIKARVNPTDQDATTEYHSVYHWDRIFAVAATAIVLMCVAIYFIISSLLSTPDKPPAQPLAPQVEVSPPTVPTTPAENTPSVTTGSGPTQIAAVEKAETLKEAFKENRKEIPEEIARESEMGATQKITLETTKAADNKIAVNDVNIALSTESPSAGRLTASVPVNPPSIEILSKDIHRAIFTHTLKNKEPNSIIENTVSLDPEGLSRVYFFTDVRDRAGDTLTHTWYRNGKKIVKVRTPIGSDTWRCSSSKYLDKTMAGEWEVKITDKQGKLVASGAFEFTTG